MVLSSSPMFAVKFVLEASAAESMPTSCACPPHPLAFHTLLLHVHAEKIAAKFPSIFGRAGVTVESAAGSVEGPPLKIGVVLSGGQAPGGHNVIGGCFWMANVCAHPFGIRVLRVYVYVECLQCVPRVGLGLCFPVPVATLPDCTTCG
jgi:hypothetical protein